MAYTTLADNLNDLGKQKIPRAFAEQNFAGAAHPTEEKVEAPPPPRYTKEDLQNAEKDGYQKGYLQGEQDAIAAQDAKKQEHEDALRHVVAALAQDLQAKVTDYNQFVKAQAAHTPHIALAIAKKMAADMLDSNYVECMWQKLLPLINEVISEPRILIEVHPSLSQPIEDKLMVHFANNDDPGEIIIEGKEAFNTTDFRIAWAHGSVERNTENLIQELTEKMMHMQWDNLSIDTLPAPPISTTESHTTPTEEDISHE